MTHRSLWTAPRFSEDEKRCAIQLLKKARQTIAKDERDRAGGAPSQICIAISTSAESQAEIDVNPKLFALVKSRLNGTPTLRLWLAARGYPVNANDPETYRKVQATRLLWIDGLIHELSFKGEQREPTGNRKNVPDARRKPRSDHRG